MNTVSLGYSPPYDFIILSIILSAKLLRVLLLRTVDINTTDNKHGIASVKNITINTLKTSIVLNPIADCILFKRYAYMSHTSNIGHTHVCVYDIHWRRDARSTTQKSTGMSDCSNARLHLRVQGRPVHKYYVTKTKSLS
jgi:hypothetical protein